MLQLEVGEVLMGGDEINDDAPVTRRDFLELKSELVHIRKEMKELQGYFNQVHLNNNNRCPSGLSISSPTSTSVISPVKDQQHLHYESTSNQITQSSELISSAINNDDEDLEDNGSTTVNSRGEKPLMNDLILKELFSKLNFPELKSCRLVCKKWNLNSSKEIRKRNVIEFNYNVGPAVNKNPMILNHTIARDSLKSSKMTKYISTFEKSESSICEHFIFVNVSFGGFITKKFFEACGHEIRRISLSLKEQHINIEQFNELLSVQVPFLECLEIRDLPSSLTEANGFPEAPYTHLPFNSLRRLSIDYWNIFSKNFLSEIFQRAQNITELNIGLLDEEYVDKVMQALLDSANAEALTNISTDSLGREDFIPLVKLSKKKMKLKSLQITNMPDQDCHAFLDFLSYQRETLEHLAFFNYGPKNLSSPLPTMPKLRNLEIAFNQPDISYGDLSFARQFPNLRMLEIEVGGFSDAGIRSEKWNEIFPDYLPADIPRQCPTVKELKFIRFEDPKMLARVGWLFPRVRKLRLEFFTNEEEILRTLWSLWGDSLEELDLEPSRIAIENVDSVFTGITPEDCNQILHEEAYDFVELSQVRCMPSICNLTKLRSLSIKYERINKGIIRHNHLFSDITGYFGLSLINTLREVSIEPSKMTEECVAKCRSKIPNFNVNA